MKKSFVMRRILGIEPKDRKQLQAYIESELLEVMKDKKLERQNIINLGVEKVLIENGYMKPAEAE